MTELERAARMALEALEKALRCHSVMLLSDPPQDAWKFHRVEQTAHEAITALRQALANEALDKKAENARELGLDYEPAQEPVPVKDNTYGYAKSLAEAIFKQHFASDEHYASGRIVWGVNDTVIGILTQIDNMVADMVRRPAQQEPVAWMPIEQMYPQANAIDILMGDGSILCAVLPQFDGDLWWEGSGTGEKFIDPKYANVTHWRIHGETRPQACEPLDLAVIRKWPDGFQDRLQHVWLDVVSFIPSVKLYDLQRVLAEYGFEMQVYEAAHGIKENT